MTGAIHCCEEMARAVSADDGAIRFSPKFREYGIAVLDGGSSTMEIRYCPWCGKKLPNSLRDKWFDCLEAESIDPYGDDVPEKYKNGQWYGWSMT